MKNLSFIYILFAGAVALTGCTDVTPNVSFLNLPSSKDTPAASSPGSFAQGDLAGSASNLTASFSGTTQYTASVVVHAGNGGNVAKSTDNTYTLQIRKISQ